MVPTLGAEPSGLERPQVLRVAMSMGLVYIIMFIFSCLYVYIYTHIYVNTKSGFIRMAYSLWSS